MKKTITIKNSRDFSRTFHKGKSYSDKFLIIYIFPNRLDINRIGISIGKKVGNSVVRNRVKRLIRESYRLIKDNIKSGFDILFVPRPASKDSEYLDLVNSTNKILKKLEMIKEVKE